MADQITEASLKLGGDWATKEGSLLGFNDQNGNYKPIPFDFTRATTATRVNRDGLIEEVQSGVPRIDFSSGDGSLLLEPQRTNLLPYNEDFSNAAWIKENITITVNDTISPDGTTNADKIKETSANTYHGISKSSSTSSGNDYTLSIFAKADERNYLVLRTNLSGSNVNTTFDLNNGLVTYNGHTSASIQSFGNGWYRCTITSNASGSSVNSAFLLSSTDVTNNNLPTYLGDGTSGFYLYGAQLEQGSYPTSYIKTSGSAVTRLADVCENTNASSYIGQTEGTLYWEVEKIVNGSDYFQISDGGTNNWILVGIDGGNAIGYVKSGGVVQAIIQTSINVGTHKMALGYAANDVVFYLNGVQIGNDTSATIPATDEIDLSQGNPSGVKTISTKTIESRLYKTRLTNTELAELTS